jgi:hypothetical protein
MKGGLSFLLIASAVVIVTGYARTSELSGATHVGVVEAVFVELRDGVYVPRATAPDAIGKPQWAHVRFPEPLEDGREATTAMLPDELRADAGDRVEVRFGQDDPPTAAATRITTVLSKASAQALVGAPLPHP